MKKKILIGLMLLFAVLIGLAMDSETDVKNLLERIEKLEQKVAQLEQLVKRLLQALEGEEQVSEEQTSKDFIHVRVLKVIDGDTLEVELRGEALKLRLNGVDTPETKHPEKPAESFGLEAWNFTKNLLTDRTVYLELDVQEYDNYGRLLAYVWLEKPDEINDETIRTRMVNAILILGGFAQLMTTPPNVKYVEFFLVYQQQAIEQKKGLWSNVVDTKDYETIVYITQGGSKYHSKNCRYVDENAIPMTLAEVKRMGLLPCKICAPPE